jgi:hypothetical protein
MTQKLLVSVVLLAGFVGSGIAQQTPRPACEQYKLRVITPAEGVEYKGQIIQPDDETDYKGIVITPCQPDRLQANTLKVRPRSTTEQTLPGLLPAPRTPDKKQNLFSPAEMLKRAQQAGQPKLP